MSKANWIQNYWGKARPSENASPVSPRWHPLAWHMLDVAATMEAILVARPVAARRLAALLQLSTADTIRLMVWLAAIHDIGKFARAFQCKVPEFWHEATLTPPIPKFDNTHHDGDGLLFFEDKCQNQEWLQRIWMDIDAQDLLDLIGASVSHHGEPAQYNQYQSLKTTFGPALADVDACLHALTALLLPEPISSPSLGAFLSATNLIAGLVTAADWLGSSQKWFPYEVPHCDAAAYWQQARVKAQGAVQDAGYAAAQPIGLTDFASLIGKSDPPTPLQAWAIDTPLPDGPALFILEDVTGAGKTEAAQILVHRLLADGRASGAYWAMPTMATANAMYTRQAALLRRLFQNDPKPSLALAHGQAALHDEFQTSLKEVGADEEALGNAHSDVTATAACQAFLGADRRLSLLADVGAGTIDQAVLSVLPSRFNTVRLAGLAEKVLVVDEAHAYDSYVETELLRLLDFQARLGGSAIILSATLTSAQRSKLMSTWQTAVSGKYKSLHEEQVASYPLATCVGLGVLSGVPIAPAQWSPRTTRVKRVASLDAVLDHLHVTLDAGGCAAWVRNTPDDVLEAAESAKSRGFEPIVFHARFAQADRQAIEQEVMGLFGPRSTPADRKGKLVIATQVIEQSLDLDFDTLASDLAPIDLLLQRAGRMRRHTKRDVRGERPVGAEDTMIVLSPPPIEDAQKDWISSTMPGTSFVYR
ncbi:MAG: CRISPR-associated helicase Cas3, partial [Pseudomonadota bacterium]